MSKKKSTSFNLLENGSKIAASVKDGLADKLVRNSDLEQSQIQIPFAMQYALNNRTLPTRRIISIIGPDAVGKTSMMMNMLGWVTLANCPSLYVETENKMMDAVRRKQCFSTNRAIAEKIDAVIVREHAFEITEMARVIQAWLDLIRDPKSDCYVPLEYPAFVGLDSFSKLMPMDEAANFDLYAGTGKDKKKGKELATGSNFSHSKAAHAWVRRFPFMSQHYNFGMFVIHHQNDDVATAMAGGGGGQQMTPDQKDANNRTTIAGRAFRQSASYEMVLSKRKMLRQVISTVNQKVGQVLKLTMTKNSYGPPRSFEYMLNLRLDNDNPETSDAVLDLSSDIPTILKSAGMGVTIKNEQEASWKEASLSLASSQEFEHALMRDNDLLQRAGSNLDIKGYLPAMPEAPGVPETTSDEAGKP